jgi:hypothetical protein
LRYFNFTTFRWKLISFIHSPIFRSSIITNPIDTEKNYSITKFKKVDRLLGNLREVELFSTKYLAEAVAVEKEKNQEQPDN